MGQYKMVSLPELAFVSLFGAAAFAFGQGYVGGKKKEVIKIVPNDAVCVRKSVCTGVYYSDGTSYELREQPNELPFSAGDYVWTNIVNMPLKKLTR